MKTIFHTVSLNGMKNDTLTSLIYAESFPVDCEFSNGVGWTSFKPSFSQSTQYTATPYQNDGCEKPGCYEDHVTYGHG